MSRKILLVLCLILSTIFCTAQTKEQEGLVKTRGRLDNDGKVIPGVVISDASIILKGGNSTVSDKKGEFSILLPSENFYLQNVQKEGYVVVDQDILSKQYAYSKNPLVLVMETPRQQLDDELAAERKIRRTLTRQLEEREKEIDRLKEENKISVEEYSESLRRLYDDNDNNEQLISDMAERYSKIDFDQLDEFYIQVSNYILNGELTKADSMLNTKGNIGSDIESLNQLKEVNAKERAELSKRQKKLEKSEAIVKHQLEDIAQRCYSKYEIFKMQHQNDSALYYLELRASLDTTNERWMNETGVFLYEYIADYDKAMWYYERSLKFDDDIDVDYNADIYNNMALICEAKNDYEKSMQYYQKALDINIHYHGINSKETASVYNNIGTLYDTMEDFDKALDYQQKAYEIKRKIYNVDNDEIALCYNNMASIYSSYGEYLISLEYYQKALEIWSKNYDDNMPEISSCYNNMSHIYTEMGKYAESLEYYNKSLDISIKVFGSEHPNVATRYGNIGTVYLGMGKYDEALEYVQKALNIRLKIFGEYSMEVAGSYGILSMVYMYQKKYQESLVYIKKCIDIQKELLGDENFSIAISYERLGLLYLELNDYDNAVSSYLKSLRIRVEKYGADNPNLASLYNNLGRTYSMMGEYTLALENLNKSVEMLKISVGEDNPNVGIVYKNIGFLHRNLKDYKKSLEYYNKSLDILRHFFNEDNSHISSIKEIIDEINLEMKK